MSRLSFGFNLATVLVISFFLVNIFAFSLTGAEESLMASCYGLFALFFLAMAKSIFIKENQGK